MAHREKIGEKRDRGSPPGSKNRHADQVRNHMTSVAQVPRCEVPPQMFWHRLCWVCIFLVSCGCLASSQQKTERRFYFPVDLKSRHGQGIQKCLRGFWPGCTADSNYFHPGVNLLAKVETPVYAISGGVVTARSGQGLSPVVVALLVRHKPSRGASWPGRRASVVVNSKPVLLTFTDSPIEALSSVTGGSVRRHLTASRREKR